MNPTTTTVTASTPVPTNRIPQSKLKKHREEQLQQNNICCICQHPISTENAVADHDHRSGRHRSILHRSCNSFISRLENSWKRYGISPEQFESICPVVWHYINTDWSHNPLHHTFKEKLVRKTRKPKP